MNDSRKALEDNIKFFDEMIIHCKAKIVDLKKDRYPKFPDDHIEEEEAKWLSKIEEYEKEKKIMEKDLKELLEKEKIL